MTVPSMFQSSQFPTAFDTDTNLFLVHDSLRVRLAEDYDPSIDPTQIIVWGDTSNFPPTGLITLTEQCSDIEKRAISFYYTGVTAATGTTNTFTGLVPSEGFENANTVVRPKRLTDVTMNVMSEHHNALKNALIAIETFVGIKGRTDAVPFGSTMEGRTNFLTKLILTPRAWFTATNTLGLVPLTVNFTNESFRLGDGNVTFVWNFGDVDSAIPISLISNISVSSVVPISAINVNVVEINTKTVQKTYTKPGNYPVTLTVTNEYGTDVVEFTNFINARIQAPIPAVIDYAYTSAQTVTAGTPSGGPYTVPPTIRSKTNQFINIAIEDGINETTGKTYAGEQVDVFNNPIDPIETYTWQLSDDLAHPNNSSTVASYSIGGIYDLVLRCDTEFGAYRITTYSQSINIIEDTNMWLFLIDGTTATSNEFGLISETFKTGTVPYTVLRDSSFLEGTNNETEAIVEFNRNTGFCPNGTINSGSHGGSLLFYASGGSSNTAPLMQTVNAVHFEGFGGTFSTDDLTISRPWNWVFLPIGQSVYFLMGTDPNETAYSNNNYQTIDTVNLGGSLTLGTPAELVNPNNYINGAQELMTSVTAGFDDDGNPTNGRFSVYRSTVQGSTGYFLRNSGVGTFFQISNFYRTEGTSSDPVMNIRKMADISGSTKIEGELVSLTNGLFFFNNSGSISAFNVVDGLWEIGSSVSPFRSFQDTTVNGYNNQANTLLACSDGDRIAYLSYDYSPNAFIKYNSVDLTFSTLGTRPTGEQWAVGIY